MQLGHKTSPTNKISVSGAMQERAGASGKPFFVCLLDWENACNYLGHDFL